jgi:hypothetical protein
MQRHPQEMAPCEMTDPPRALCSVYDNNVPSRCDQVNHMVRACHAVLMPLDGVVG